MQREIKTLLSFIFVFLLIYFAPIDNPKVQNAINESLLLTQWYAREHVLLCLVPAFFIAGAIGVFISQQSVMKYLGASANKILAYAVASVSGAILAVCSCTILPLFAGIYRMGAGLGPAIAFLYSGPAINILAIILTARILGLKIGLARAIGAISFSIIIGLIMQLIFRNEQTSSQANIQQVPNDDENTQRPLWQNAIYFASMIGILIFANWAKPNNATDSTVWASIYIHKWQITAAFACLLSFILIFWFGVKLWKVMISAGIIAAIALYYSDIPVLAFTIGAICLSLILATENSHLKEWLNSTWWFAKLILPLLFVGVLIAGLLLGRVGHEGLIPSEWIASAVGGNSLRANLFASVAGAFMYFATLTEVPILQGLIGAGMGKGPALALLLAGPALSLPNMLVIRSVIGTKKTACYVTLVVIMATISGIIFGYIA